MRWVWKIGVLFACLVLVACGGGQGNDAADSVTPAGPTFAAADMSIGDVVWSESASDATGEPGEVVEMFTPQSPAIIASIEVTEVPAGTEFSATWTLNDEPIEADEMQVRADSDLGQGWVSFRFTREEGQSYPLGDLGVVVTASTGETREASIEVAFP